MLKIDERPAVYIPADEILAGDQIVIENMVYFVGYVDPKAKHYDGTTPAVTPVFHLYRMRKKIDLAAQGADKIYPVPCIDTPIRVWKANRFI